MAEKNKIAYAKTKPGTTVQHLTEYIKFRWEGGDLPVEGIGICVNDATGEVKVELLKPITLDYEASVSGVVFESMIEVHTEPLPKLMVPKIFILIPSTEEEYLAAHGIVQIHEKNTVDTNSA